MMPLLLALLFQLQIPAPTGYVNDFARILQPQESAAIQQIIDEVRQKCGGEIVVVTMSDLGGRASIDVARDIGRQWKVGAMGGAGDQKRNTGVIVLLQPGQHPGDGKADVAIATGSGSEGFVTDALAGRVRDAIGRTSIDRGSYGAGLVAGTAVIAQAYAQEFGFTLTGEVAQEAPPERAAPRSNRQLPWPVIVFIVIFFLFVLTRRGATGSLARGMLWGMLLSGRGGGGGGFGGGGGGGFGGFGGGGGFSGGGASGRF